MEGGGWPVGSGKVYRKEACEGIISSRLRETVGSVEDFSRGKKEKWLLNGSDSIS